MEPRKSGGEGAPCDGRVPEVRGQPCGSLGMTVTPPCEHSWDTGTGINGTSPDSPFSRGRSL